MMEPTMKILVYDIETIFSYFLTCIYVPEEEEWYDFSMSERHNDIDKLMKFIEGHKDYYWVGYNNINFDSQIIEDVIRNHENWYDYSGLDISKYCWKRAQDIIDDQNYGLFPPYQERDLTLKQIDIPKIQHWFNDAKRVSLKQLEFELRAEDIENFEVDHRKEHFTEEEEADLIKYCHNDIKYTYLAYLYTIGQTEHPLYKGKNKIADRMAMQKEIGLHCLNMDDVKIGSEWNKMDYVRATKADPRELKPLKVNHFYGKKFSQFFPKTVKFKEGGELRKWVKENIADEFTLSKKQEFKYRFPNELLVTIAKGGLHSNEKPRLITPSESEIYLQVDIGSQYPNAIRKFGIYPSHLGKAWNEMIVDKIERRLKYKALYKETKNPDYNSLQEAGKLSLNGGSFGKLNCPGDWQQDPCAMLKVTIGCQMEILMIIEALVSRGFNIVSGNTDGFDAVIDKSRYEEFIELCKYYEKVIGNDVLGNMEYTQFQWIAQTSVNDYIAKKMDGTLKLKGDFVTDYELYKNSSFRAIPLALVEYFDKGTKPEDFLKNHANIFDFCARSSSGSTYYHESYGNLIREDDLSEEEFKKEWVELYSGWVKKSWILDPKIDQYKAIVDFGYAWDSYRQSKRTYKTCKLPKLIRYYVSNEGVHIKKIVKEGNDTGANDLGIRPATLKKTVCNHLPPKDYQRHLENVNRRWYIDECESIIYKIKNGKAPKIVKVPENQLSLF